MTHLLEGEFVTTPPGYRLDVLDTEVDGSRAFELFAQDATYRRVVAHAKVWADEAILVDLFVHEAHRRKGVGRCLVKMARQLVDPASLRVYYLPSSPARPLFASLDFQETPPAADGVPDEYIWAVSP